MMKFVYKPGGGTSQYNEHFRLRERCCFFGERDRLLRRLALWLSTGGDLERLPLLRERSRDLFFREFPRSRSEIMIKNKMESHEWIKRLEKITCGFRFIHYPIPYIKWNRNQIFKHFQRREN